MKSVLWRVAKRLSYVEDARCLKVNGRLSGRDLKIQLSGISTSPYAFTVCRGNYYYYYYYYYFKQRQIEEKGILCYRNEKRYFLYVSWMSSALFLHLAHFY